ncbi:hypothetical protein [uncultured Dubosiella sp.]|uniref:hypothetical protein n=2 Tax=uncultured Dubosiella sp. TaxID=1937011 RepID=UPI002730AD3A|nr:hypothetical protein [uncultured Dubosiella sp.]
MHLLEELLIYIMGHYGMDDYSFPILFIPMGFVITIIESLGAFRGCVYSSIPPDYWGFMKYFILDLVLFYDPWKVSTVQFQLVMYMVALVIQYLEMLLKTEKKGGRKYFFDFMAVYFLEKQVKMLRACWFLLFLFPYLRVYAPWVLEGDFAVYLSLLLIVSEMIRYIYFGFKNKALQKEQVEQDEFVRESVKEIENKIHYQTLHCIR